MLRITPATPGPPDPSGGRPVWRATLRRLGWMLAAALLVTIIVYLLPPAPGEQRDPAAAHRLEYVDLDGTGIFTGVARWTLRATARAAAFTVDGQTALLTPTPLATRTVQPVAQAVRAWHAPHNGPVRILVLVAAMVLAGLTVWAQSSRRAWATALAVLILACVGLTRPGMLVTAANLPGRTVAAGALLVQGDHSEIVPAPLGGPINPAAPGGLVEVQRRLGDAYWSVYVTGAVSRAATGTTILTQVDPADRAALTDQLAGQLTDGGRGSPSGLQRSWYGVSGLAAISPVNVPAGVLTWLAWSAQTLAFVLMLAGFALGPVWIHRRRWQALILYWAAPLLGSLLVTFLAATGSWLITRWATWAATTAEYGLSMLTGPVLVLVAGVLATTRIWRAVRWVFRRAGITATKGKGAPGQDATGEGAQAA